MEPIRLYCSRERARPDSNSSEPGVIEMANPIPLELPRPDPRLALQARLENAPAAHAEALLAAYEVLQGLHDRGVLDLMRGALGSGDKVLEIGVTAAQSPASIRS